VYPNCGYSQTHVGQACQAHLVEKVDLGIILIRLYIRQDYFLASHTLYHREIHHQYLPIGLQYLYLMILGSSIQMRYIHELLLPIH